MPSWFDVDAPDTSWRGSSEDPIPVLLGRWPITAFLYRWFTARPLDGHARTDATFLHEGTKCFTKSGHCMPYQYWPGWKRGLMTRLPANTFVSSFLLAYLIGGWHAVGSYLHFYGEVIAWCFTW